MKRPDRVRDATDHLISSPGAAARVVGYIESLEAENERLLNALREHECSGDGYIEQACYVRIMDGGKCSATEALNLGKEKR